MSAQILPFPNQGRGRSFARKAADAGVVPTVVILPCVRYERWGDDEGQESLGVPAQAAPARH